MEKKNAVCRKPHISGGRGWMISGERGIALVLVLILSAIALTIMSALIYMLTVRTQASGSHKRYRTAVEAGSAGTGIAFEMIDQRGNLTLSGIAITKPNNVDASAAHNNCLVDKLNKKTADWNGCSCTDYIDPTDAATYDWSFNLGDPNRPYTVYAKIVDTVDGNTGGNSDLSKGGVVTSNDIPVVQRPYMYTIEVAADQGGSLPERARYSALYQY